MSGAGNDFVIVDNRAGAIQNGSELARKVCDRRWGIGADGLLLIEKSSIAAYRMMYYNADGSYGGMCGNGGRCISFYAVENSIAGTSHSFEALEHVYVAVVRGTNVTLTMRDPKDIRMNLVLRGGAFPLKGHFINTGSPHVVIPFSAFGKRYSKLADLPVPELGKKIRHHRLFQPEGTNVNFMQKAGAKTLILRTYERGVEGETFACGTGSIASAIIASRIWKMTPPITVIPPSRVALLVDFKGNGSAYINVRLTGEVKITFKGEIDG
jgi:diaminopimelate epimerase